MRRRRSRIGRVVRRPPSLVALLVLGTLVGVLLVVLDGSAGVSRAAAGASEPTPQTDAAVPAGKVTMIGSSPGEAPDETWGVGEVGEGVGASPSRLVRYTSEAGWGLGPALLDSDGQPLQGFKLDHPQGLDAPSPLAGQMTGSGDGALIGTVPSTEGEEQARQVVLVRRPGGAFQVTPPVSGEGEGELLKEGERLFGQRRAPLLAPLDEGGGQAGAFVVPISEAGSVEDGVLHWDGSHWTREPIAIPQDSSEHFRVLAIGASSPSNAWLLAALSSAYPSGAVALFRRVPVGGGEAGFVWKPVTLGSVGSEEADPIIVDEQPFTVRGSDPPTLESQALTVTDDGVWVDGERADVGAPTTLYFKPEGGPHGLIGRVQAAWCQLPAGAPEGTPQCDHPLPDAMPSGPSRSIAWANPALPYGERVISGLADGVSLRLDGEEFTRVLALGGSAHDPGGTYGAAFANPREGWLGAASLPVHLTLKPTPTRLTPWPVPFRHALDAVAPQPGAPAGALSSEALAVGERGQVARYRPGQGWLAESLFGSGGRRQTPHLRAVAWPTPTRAFAVGDLGQMWLWRGETGLWERDPATPRNFRGNLLGVAFDPNNPARGYAVGSGGVLLRYGKSWSQDALPPQAQGASFTSIAFAGSEAIVAYRILPNRQVNRFVGGLLVNDGSGWRVDEALAAKLGENVPDTVAGLPDGAAAVSASGASEGPAIYERESASAAWQPTTSPLPPTSQPGSLALFREGSALRAIAAGGPANGFGAESVTPAPPGFPPDLIAPYGPVGGGVLRQTAGGWSDEQHELDYEGKVLPGGYAGEDKVFEPDPVFAVLTSPDGTQGWAVGGFASSTEGLSTGDVERYPADGSTPSGVGTAAVPTTPQDATFALGGDAQCLAPCADRANGRLGPDVWLSAALARAGQIAGVRAFLYTGPHVTAGKTIGPETVPVPFARELPRYAELLASSPIPAFAVTTPDDLDARPFARGTEATFEQAFARFPQPFGSAPVNPEAGFTDAGRSEECTSAPGCQAGYYAFDSAGAAGAVRVIVLDNSGDVGPTQRAWLATELTQAEERTEPAIVVGEADLEAEISAGDGEALAAAQTLVQHHASAYFYDSPEVNEARSLRVGGGSLPTFGSGTLGYISLVNERSSEFHGASGFLLAQVNASPAARNPSTGLFPVTVRLIPSIGELAMEGKDGTLLRRSQAALFSALARRPRAGGDSHGIANAPSETDPYIPIPSNCVGAGCSAAILPEYTFSSSRPDIGDFVQPNLASPDPHAVLLGSNDKPIADSQSGLFCAYNAGTTIVTISAGGLSASVPVTVQAGSVRRPCGTQPLKEIEPQSQAQQAPVPPPAPAPSPAPAGAAPAAAPAPVPVPAPPPAPTPAHPPAPVASAPLLATPVAPLLAFVPPPLPTPARPTPPSGTSAVTSPIEVAEHEDEEEEATESVSNQAVAYRAGEGTPSPVYLLGIVVLAAFAGATARRRPRRGLRRPRVAPALLMDDRTRPAPRWRRRP